jgi:hypothetical protein
VRRRQALLKASARSQAHITSLYGCVNPNTYQIGGRSMSDKIKIDTVHGGSTKDNLKGCYFLPTANPGDYEFYDKNNNPIETDPSPLVTGTDFSFTLAELDWTISNFIISPTEASGDFSNQPEEDEGSFQAQAGPGVEETVSSANA